MDDVAPGNPAGIRELARHWADQGRAADEASSTLGSAKADIEGGTLGLKGDFAPKIRDAIGDLPGELQKLARGYAGCGRALDTFATKLTEAQQKSRRARDDWDVAAQSKRNAEYDLDQLAPGWDVYAQNPAGLRTHLAGQPEPVMTAVNRRENAERDVDLATTLSRQAAALRGDAERQCVREIKSALADSGLENRKWYQKVGDYLKESFTTWDGFVKFCENVAMVLGVVALFLSGPLALIVGAILLITAAVAIADKLKKLADGEIGWKDLAFELGMVVLSRFGGRALGPAFRRLSHTKAVKAFSNQVHKGANRLADKLKLGDRARNLAHRGICTVTGHPIDVATGKLFTQATDLELPGPLPFGFERVWYSTSTYRGPLGHGWHHRYDAALYASADALLYRTPDGRVVDLMPLYPDTQYYDRQERLTLSRDGAGYRIRTADGVVSRFSAAPVLEASDSGTDEPAPVVHRLRDLVSPGGHRISLSYDERGLLSEIVDSGGRELRFDYDESGRIVLLTAPDPDLAQERYAVARYRYDDLGNLVSVRDALDHELSYEYAEHLMIRETNRTGLSFQFEYDGATERARCVHTWGDGGLYDHTLSYQPGLTTVTNSLGHQTRHEHQDGLVIRSVDALGGDFRTEFEYQQPVRQTDALGRVTSYEYDYRGNRTRSTNPDGSSLSAEFDNRDLAVSAVDRVGGKWFWSYDEAELLQERRDPLERRWTFSYPGGLLGSITDPAGGLISLSYDERGSLAALTDQNGATSRWQRNQLGWPVAAVDPLGNVEQTRFDLTGRAIQVREPDGNVFEMSYDGEGNLLSVVDQLTDVRYSYQGLGRPASRTQAGTTLRFEYNTEEQLTAVVNEHGRVHGLGYGPTGELVSERGFDEMLRLYERDLAGRVLSLRRAGGGTSGFEYDAADRIVAVTHSDGARERFEYRADGWLSLAENDTSVVRLERDLLGRVRREIQGADWVENEYDALGFRVRVRSSRGAEQVIERNPVGAAVGVQADGFAARFTRNLLGQELDRELPGGVRARWHRDGLGRPVRHEVSGPGGTLQDRSYAWELDDRLSGVTDALSGPIRFQHDALGQLAGTIYPDGRTELRMPDAVGNLFRTEDRSDRVYGPAGQLLEATDPERRRVSYQHDPDGNLVSKRASDGAAWAYRWAVNGTLTEVTRPDGAVVGFEYDSLGRRLAKTYRGRRTRWIWDGDNPLHEWVEGVQDPERGSADAPITWLFEPDRFAPLARLLGQSRTSILADHLGTPVLVLDAAGAPIWSGELSSWGGPGVEVGNRWVCPFRRPGQYEDVETGLTYNRFRYYDPEAGQYLSQDPIGLAGGFAPYSYVLDPLLWTDPFGLNVTTGADRDHIVYRGVKWMNRGGEVRGEPYTGYASAPSSEKLTGQQILERRYSKAFPGFADAPQVVYEGSGAEGKDIARGLERYYYDMDVLEYDVENVANDKVPLRGHPREAIRAQAAADHLRGCQ